MNAIYQRTVSVHFLKENEVPDNWTCPICTESDSKAKGGAVFHKPAVNSLQQISKGIDHPAHRDCVLGNYRYRKTCHSCRAPIDPTPIMTYSEWMPNILRKIPGKLFEGAQGAYGIFQRTGPLVKQTAGIAFLLVGLTQGFVLLLPIGTHLWSRGMHHEELIWRENERKMDNLAAKAREWATLNGGALTPAQEEEIVRLVEALKNTGDDVASRFVADKDRAQTKRQKQEKASSLWWTGAEYSFWKWFYKGSKHLLNTSTALFTLHLLKRS